MTKPALTELVNELNSLILALKYEEALDQFYSDEIISVENENPPLKGLANYRTRASIYLESIRNYSAELKNVIIRDDMSVTEWHYRFNHKDWGKWDRVQLSLQRWKDGKIIHERHHYKME